MLRSFAQAETQERTDTQRERCANWISDRLNGTNWILISFKFNFMIQNYKLKAFGRIGKTKFNLKYAFCLLIKKDGQLNYTI